jgi:hypothetical protein
VEDDSGGLSERILSGLLADPFQPGVFYVAETVINYHDHPPSFRGAILRSTDGGVTWRPTDTSWLPIFDPREPQTVYQLSGGVFRRSTDGGRTFATIGRPGPALALGVLLLDPADPRTFYAFGSLGASRSRDGGFTWELLAAWPRYRYPLNLFLDPRRHTLTTSTGGLFQLRIP